MSEALPEATEVRAVARGIATAVAPESGLTDVQASLLHSVTLGVTGESVDYHDLEPLDAEGHGIDLLAIDYHEIADQPINDLRAELHIVPKSPEALGAGSPGLFEPAGMSPTQRKALRTVVNRGTIVQ